MKTIGVIGFGFSGLMVVANLVRQARAPLLIYIVDEEANGLGVAYGTDNPDHLLNVRAGSMSALADDPDHLLRWLATQDAAFSRASLGVTQNFSAMDFIPRALYGSYLVATWRDTQALAAQKNIQLKLVPSQAVALQPGSPVAVLTQRGDAIALDKIVLAVGHETKHLASLGNAEMIQHPWAQGALAEAKRWSAPVMVVGTSLTAIDAMLTLRREGYRGEIIMASRRGYLPQAHELPAAVFNFTTEEIAAAKTLRQMLRLLRNKINAVGDWRVVFDALRPHTQSLWQRLDPGEQKRFLFLLSPLWGVHRHRMAERIAAQVHGEIAAKTLRIVKGSASDAVQGFRPSHVVNGSGLELNLARSRNPLLRQLLAGNLVEPHITGLGIAADRYYRAWGDLYPSLYVVGSLLTGQLLESTAVPELREQAASIAQSLLSDA